MLYLQYYLNFYSDAALTQSNISQTQNIGFKYILWMYKYDKYNVLVSSGKLAEQTVILYPGTTTYTFPEKILNAVPYTLDNSVYEYEISEFGYR